MNNPWNLSTTDVALMVGLAQHGFAKPIAAALGRSVTYVDTRLSQIVRRMGCANRIQAAVAFDRWHREQVILQGLSQEQAERIDMNLALRLRQACLRDAA